MNRLWKYSLVACTFLLLLGCGERQGRVPFAAEGLFNLEDTLTAGLDYLPGVEHVDVWLQADGYSNNVVLTHFQDRYYCMWQHSERDEDTPDTHVLYATSRDGKAWSGPMVLAGPTDSCFVSPGGWIQRGDSLSALLNYIRADDRKAGGSAWFTSTRDGLSWSAPQPVLLADGNPIQGLFEQDPLPLAGGRTVGAIHFMPGLELCPVYTDDPSALRGWTKAVFPPGEDSPLEPSQYARPDGSLVMLLRDQQSSFVKLASISCDSGQSWSAPVRTNLPDSRSKQCAGTLPSGTAFWVGNPTGNKSRRLLAIGLSQDGVAFDRAYLLSGPADLPAQRTPGRYKTLGYNYPKAHLAEDALWISLSLNKERVVLFRIPLKLLN